MSAPIAGTAPAAGDGASRRGVRRPPLGGLLLAEVHRLTARRFVRWLLALAALGYLVGMPLIGVTQFGRITEADRAVARQRVEQLVAEQKPFYDQCLKNVPKDQTPESFCGPPPSAENFPIEQFYPRTPFDLAQFLRPGAVAVGVAVAALLFVVGATWVGAEWSQRTMMALLFWEPRRLRVLGVKAGVLALAAALVGALAQAVWWGTAMLLGRTRGSTGPLPKDFWQHYLGLAGGTVLLAVMLALLGFAVAHLIRNTGAALGLGFVYFAVVETAVRIARPAWQEWLLTTNVSAMLGRRGTTITVPGPSVDAQGQVQSFREVLVSNLHGGLVVGGVTLGLLAVGAWWFRRRDLT